MSNLQFLTRDINVILGPIYQEREDWRCHFSCNDDAHGVFFVKISLTPTYGELCNYLNQNHE